MPSGDRSFLSVVLTTVFVTFCTQATRGVSERLAPQDPHAAVDHSSGCWGGGFLQDFPPKQKTLMIFFYRKESKRGSSPDAAGVFSMPASSLEENQRQPRFGFPRAFLETRVRAPHRRNRELAWQRRGKAGQHCFLVLQAGESQGGEGWKGNLVGGRETPARVRRGSGLQRVLGGSGEAR